MRARALVRDKALTRVCLSLIPPPPLFSVQTMDIQGDGTLDYEEFLAATVHSSKAASEDALFEAFAELDTDGSGLVTADELAAKLSELGMSVNAEELQMMLDEGDSNRDGYIDYMEFLDLMSPGERERGVV